MPKVRPAPREPFGAVCTCLALRQATRQVTQLYDAALSVVGLRVTQYSVLAVLGRRGASTVQDLAAELVMDRSTLGHNLRPLERSGLVVLAVDEADRRAKRLELSALGRAKLDEAMPHWRAAQRSFDDAFGAERAAALRALMQDVVATTTG